MFLLGNRRGNGSFRENPLAEWEQVPFGNGIPGLGTLLIIDNGIESRDDARCCCRPRSRSRMSRTGA